MNNANALPLASASATSATTTLSRVSTNPFTGQTGTNRFVLAQAGPLAVYHDTWYGGAPLTFARDGKNIFDPFAGTGFGANIETGQDGTQASANGLIQNRIALLNDAATTAKYNYYGRETLFTTYSDGSSSYNVTGFLPHYLLSHEPADDAIPKYPGRGDHGWITKYHLRGRPASLITGDATVPVYFEGSPTENVGFLFVGNEMLPTATAWNQRLLEIPQGRIAMRASISLLQASAGAWAGFKFRTQVTAAAVANINDAYGAKGYSLNANKTGVLELLKWESTGGVPKRVWGGVVVPEVQATINTAAGTLLEIRTHNGLPGRLEFFANGKPVGVYNDPNPLVGPHVALVASANSGLVKFGNREVFDVGYEHSTTYTGHSDGTYDVDMTVRNATGVSGTRKMYRAVVPAFLNQTTVTPTNRAVWAYDRQGRRLDDVNGRIVNLVTPGPDGIASLWVGDTAGTLGLSAKVLATAVNGQPATGTHAYAVANASNLFLHINALDFGANSSPRDVSSVRLAVRYGWRPQIEAQPEISVVGVTDAQPTPIDFGVASLNSPAPTRTFTVRNDGGVPLLLGQATVPAGYSVVDQLVSSLAPGQTDNLIIRLDTSVQGVKSGIVRFATNDADENPFDFPVTAEVRRQSGTVIIDEDFEDGRVNGFDYVPPVTPQSQVVTGDSYTAGSKAYQITYDRDEYGANLEKYDLHVNSIDVSYASKLPDGIPVDNAGQGFVGLKQSRLFRATGSPAFRNMQHQIDYYRAGYDGLGSPAHYEMNYFIEYSDRVFHVPIAITPDAWYHVRYFAQFNTPGENDGIFMVWHNGNLVVNARDVAFSDTLENRFDSVFVGGNFSYRGVNPDRPFRRLIDNVRVVVNGEVPNA